MIYYIADMHFGHKNVLRFDNRPFADTDLMDEVLVHNWNERVTDDDTAYMLGDAFWKNEENSVKLIQRLNGHKHLIRGNHDRVHGRLRFHWESIEQYVEINDSNTLVIMSHYLYKNQHHGAVMLYGHVHNTREWQLVEKWKQEQWEMGIPSRLINVGCMMEYIRYTPRTLAELLDELFRFLERAAPVSENGARELWLRAERGPIEDFGDAEELIREGDYKNKDEFIKSWKANYPDEIKWYQFAAVELKNEGCRAVMLRHRFVIVQNKHREPSGFPNEIPDFVRWLIDGVKECIQMLRNGTYNDFVRENLSPQHRTGTIRRKDFWAVWPEAFQTWLRDRERHGGHPWEVCCGGNSTHVSL